ncbi:hypothetical protein PG990_002191 [Apiospora arundinis]|uniref:Uncharacterized protein n=1 Tax=Apiospora arundinis TaxID=335852 RepID=A0ABR2I415_9PEZI
MSSRTTTQEQGGPSDFKEILDKKAFEARHPNAGQEEPTLLEKVAEKVTEYIPAAAKVLGTDKKEAEEKSPEPEKTPGPPERPHHDVNIEEFVREQHRSKKDKNGQVIDG